MSSLSEDDVKQALEPFHNRIKGVVERAFSEWLDLAECQSKKGYTPVLYPRTATNYIFDAIARVGIDEFFIDDDVRVIEEAQTVKFCFSNLVVARFKKADGNGLGQNIATQAVMDFTDPQMLFPGLPPEAAKVEFTWTPNIIGTEIDRVTVLLRDGDHIIWAYDIDDEGISGNTTPFPTPSDPDDGEPPMVLPRKLPKSNIESE